MADSESDRLILDPDAWTDAPVGVVESLKARAKAGVVIDASATGAVPAQVAQLLLSVRATARAAGKDLRLHAPSEAARESLEALGLSHLVAEDAS